MLDWVESMENAAESRYEEMEQPDGHLKCSCGNLFDPSDGQMISVNPWSMPVCNDCFVKFITQDVRKGDT